MNPWARTSLDDLIAASAKLGFKLSKKEAVIYREAMEDFVTGVSPLSQGADSEMSGQRLPREFTQVLPPEENPLNAFITRCLVKGSGAGPLAGRRVGVKDCVAVAGIPMTLGSRFMEGFIPDTDATIVTRILDGGGDIVGKLNMDDFSRSAHGFGTGIGDYGRCPNPYLPDHLSGGSSSGCAVGLAVGAVDLAIGGDQGGSIRIPAAWCGVVGLKPTYGLVPHTGVVGIEPSIDHVGPMARTSKDVALLLECIAGLDGRDSRCSKHDESKHYTQEISKGIDGIRIGILREGFGDRDAEADVEECVREAIWSLRGAGAKVSEVSVPEHVACGKILPALSFPGIAIALGTDGLGFQAGYYDTSLISAFGKFRKSRSHLLPPPVKLAVLMKVQLGHFLHENYARAQNLRRRFRRAYDEVFREVDCLVMPTVPIKAPRWVEPKESEEVLRRSLLRPLSRVATKNTASFNVTGHPALTVPCGISQGLPVGLMLVGPHYSDDVLLRIAHSFECIGGATSHAPSCRNSTPSSSLAAFKDNNPPR